MTEHDNSAEQRSGGQLRIDLDALASNYRLLAARTGGAPAAMVKANAYGIGLEPTVRRLTREGCHHFFVARLSEAQRAVETVNDLADSRSTRAEDATPATGQARRTSTVFVLDGVAVGAEREMAEIQAIPVLSSLDQIDRWRSAANRLGRTLPAALHVDTGMRRLGLTSEEWKTLIAEPQRLDGLSIAHIMSHLARADDDAVTVTQGGDPAFSARQLERFQQARRHFPSSTASLANSAGIFCGAGFHFDFTRPGIALYGGSPWGTARRNPMQPVATATVPVLQIQTVQAGEPVGYGGSWRAPQTTRIATIGVGYADGYPRALSNRGAVVVGETGERAQIVGRVSMDLTTIDVGNLSADSVRPGTRVELFGPHMPIDEVADKAETIAYELLTNLGRRYRRTYSGSSLRDAGPNAEA